jgi:glutamate racemase
VYLGDTARVPYGTKSPETVARYSTNVARTLLSRGCGALVIACNTASAFGMEAVREMAGVPVFDVIEPVSDAVAASDATSVLILGTQGTVKSRAYVRALESRRADLVVSQRACPLFVPLAEEGWVEGDVPRLAAERYLRGVLATTDIDSLVLGCTHYPLLRPVIEDAIARFAARPVAIHDTAFHTATALRAAIGDGTQSGGVEFLVSDDPTGFVQVAERFLGEPVTSAEHVEVG